MAQPSDRRQQPSQPPLPFFRGPGGPGQLGMGSQARARDARGTVQRIWGYLRRQRGALVLTVFLVVITTGLGLIGPYLLGRAIDLYIRTGDLAGLADLLLLMLGVYAALSLFTWLQIYTMVGVAQRTVRDMRNDLFSKFQVIPLRYFDQRAHGDLMSRMTNDIENVNVVLSDGVTQLVSGVLSIFGVAAVMLWLNPLLAVISMSTSILFTFVLNRWVIP